MRTPAAKPLFELRRRYCRHEVLQPTTSLFWRTGLNTFSSCPSHIAFPYVSEQDEWSGLIARGAALRKSLHQIHQTAVLMLGSLLQSLTVVMRDQKDQKLVMMSSSLSDRISHIS